MYMGGVERDPAVEEGEEPKTRARAGLERGREGEAQGVRRWVTAELARERMGEAAAEQGAGVDTRAWVDQLVAWDEEGGEGVWRNTHQAAAAGYARLHDVLYDEDGEEVGTMRSDPLLRMLLRYDGMESGTDAVVDQQGREVWMDKQERGLMWGQRGGDIESAKVARVAAALHLVH